MASTDYIMRTDPERARAAVADALAEHGFAVTGQTPQGWTIARGSRAMTIAFGALAGRRHQRLRYQVDFFDHQGFPVVRLRRDGASGIAGGFLGRMRSEQVFAEVSEAVAARLDAQGLLQQLLRSA